MDRLKQIIAVSWAMPPMVLPRAIQIARTLKTLDQWGWTSDVVCAPASSVEGATLDQRFADLYKSHYRPHILDYKEALSPSAWPRRMIRKWRPPRHIDDDNWIERAGKFVLQFSHRVPSDVLVTFAQPWIDHLAGLYVKQRCKRLPWLAHFSDPWIDNPYLKTDTSESKAQMAIWREQEKAVIQSADAVVFVTEQTADLVMRKYPDAWRSKVHIVPHGFDRDLLQPARSEPAAGGPLRFAYTGIIYAGVRDPKSLFEALAMLGGPERLSGRLAVDFYGNSPVETMALRDDMGLRPIVKFHGNVGYLDCLRMASSADVLLLIDAGSDINVFLPSKIADYLMFDLPILGLTPKEGASAAILAKTGNFVAPPQDPGAIADILGNLLERHENDKLLSLPGEVANSVFDIGQTTLAFEGALLSAMERAKGAVGRRRADAHH